MKEEPCVQQSNGRLVDGPSLKFKSGVTAEDKVKQIVVISSGPFK